MIAGSWRFSTRASSPGPTGASFSTRCRVGWGAHPPSSKFAGGGRRRRASYTASVNALVLLAGFFAGAIPFGVLIAKRRGVDIRKQGSGNIGATNVTRVMGLGAGLVVLVLDALKGVAAVMLATRLSGFDPIITMAGFAAILGHCFS